MSFFSGNPQYAHGTAAKIGVLLVNLGTPDAPSAAAVRPYLRRFLGDRRVVEAPRLLWWFVLNAVILPFRPARTAAAYAKIWRSDGSPLLTISRRISIAVQTALNQTNRAAADNDRAAAAAAEDNSAPFVVALGMSYSAPFIKDALRALQQQNCRYILVLPLYPQYAGSTVGAVFDDIAAALRRWRFVPHLRFIAGYADDPRYIAQLAQSVRDYRRQHGGADKLVFSFHGTPLKMLQDGDPYYCMCRKTARLTAAALNLSPREWLVTFQSRFGRAVWLQPYTDETLAALPPQGVSSVQVISPAFAADCLETLEELAQENRDVFLTAGGKKYGYIPALNDSAGHVNFLSALLADAAADWRTALNRDDAAQQKHYYQLDNSQNRAASR